MINSINDIQLFILHVLYFYLPANVPVVNLSIMLFNLAFAAFLASASALSRNSIATERFRIISVLFLATFVYFVVT